MFDSRVGSWMMEESMNEARGYFGAVVLRDSICVLGGLNGNGTILDTVCISYIIMAFHAWIQVHQFFSFLFVVILFVQMEWYEPSHGWRENDLKGFRRRCAFCIVVL